MNKSSSNFFFFFFLLIFTETPKLKCEILLSFFYLIGYRVVTSHVVNLMFIDLLP